MDIQAGIRRPKIDVHTHVDPMPATDASADALVEAGEALGVVEMWCSLPAGPHLPTPEEIRQRNDAVLRAMERHPRRIRGLCFVVPGYFREAVAEVERCLDAGMIGIKLYNQYRISDPAAWPVIDLAAERRVPILEHAGYLTAPEHLAQQPLVSHGADFAAASRRRPDAMLIHAHIGGGGDWEWTVRAMRGTSANLYIDTSGSNLDDGQIELAAAEMGPRRILFGSDGTSAGSVGKVLGATLGEADRELIFWGNAARILAAQGKEPLHPRSGRSRRRRPA